MTQTVKQMPETQLEKLRKEITVFSAGVSAQDRTIDYLTSQRDELLESLKIQALYDQSFHESRPHEFINRVRDELGIEFVAEDCPALSLATACSNFKTTRRNEAIAKAEGAK